jgi:hypothetical protein
MLQLVMLYVFIENPKEQKIKNINVLSGDFLCKRYIEESILRSSVAIETQGFSFVTSGKKRDTLKVIIERIQLSTWDINQNNFKFIIEYVLPQEELQNPKCLSSMSSHLRLRI